MWRQKSCVSISLHICTAYQTEPSWDLSLHSFVVMSSLLKRSWLLSEQQPAVKAQVRTWGDSKDALPAFIGNLQFALFVHYFQKFPGEQQVVEISTRAFPTQADYLRCLMKCGKLVLSSLVSFLSFPWDSGKQPQPLLLLADTTHRLLLRKAFSSSQAEHWEMASTCLWCSPRRHLREDLLWPLLSVKYAQQKKGTTPTPKYIEEKK